VIISCSFATEKSADCYRAGGWCAGGFTDHMNLQTATAGGSGALEASLTISLFFWLISHQSAVLFSQNKSATSNQPAVLLSQNKSAPAISRQPNEQAPC
jgi:hypothetical protein